MNVREVFELMIEIGMENDPRGKKKVLKVLKNIKREFQSTPKKKKEEFDQDKLINPYADSAIHCGETDKTVKRVLVGIDIGVSEILLAKELEKHGKKIDLIIAHHPIGKALAKLADVMDIQVETLVQAGVPENIAEGVLRDRLSEVTRGVAPINHYREIDAAKLLGIGLVNVHTPADNCVWKYLEELMEKKKPGTLGKIVDELKKIPEYCEATKMQFGPAIYVGSEKSRAGKIVVTGVTGGTSGSQMIYERMSHYGVGTEIAMHIREQDRDEAGKHYVNVVIAGHISSDSLGMNIVMDELEKNGIEIIPCSGFIRVSRV